MQASHAKRADGCKLSTRLIPSFRRTSYEDDTVRPYELDAAKGIPC